MAALTSVGQQTRHVFMRRQSCIHDNWLQKTKVGERRFRFRRRKVRLDISRKQKSCRRVSAELGGYNLEECTRMLR